MSGIAALNAGSKAPHFGDHSAHESFFKKNWCYGLGKDNSLKTRIMTMIISKPLSRGNGISFPISCVLQRGNLLSLCKMGLLLTSFIHIRFLYLLPQNDHAWNPETVIWCNMFVLSEDSVRPSLRLKVWLDLSVDGCTPKTLPSLMRVDCGETLVELHQKFLLSFDLWPLETMSLGMWDEHSWCEQRIGPPRRRSLKYWLQSPLENCWVLTNWAETQITHLHFTSWATLPGKTEKTDRKCLKRFRWMR